MGGRCIIRGRSAIQEFDTRRQMQPQEISVKRRSNLAEVYNPHLDRALRWSPVHQTVEMLCDFLITFIIKARH